MELATAYSTSSSLEKQLSQVAKLIRVREAGEALNLKGSTRV